MSDPITLTPYQRCLAAIEGDPLDKMPAYTPTICSDVASNILGRPVDTGGPALWYAEAIAWAAGPSAYAEFEHKYEEDLLALHRALDLEVFRYGYRRNIKPTAQLDEYTFLVGDMDGPHQIWRWDPEIMNLVPSVDTLPKPKPEDWPRLAREQQAQLPQRVAAVRESAGRAEAEIQARLGEEMFVVAGGGGFSVGITEAALMAALLEPGAIHDMLDCQLEVALAQVEAIAKRGIKVILGGGDMADNHGPMYAPKLFREFILPRLRVFSARCAELGMHYVWRTDGKIWSVSDMIFQEAGVPGYGEVDYDATMTTGAVRARYPDLVIWGNGSASILRWGSAQDAYAHSMEMLRASGGHGYFHGCSNAIMPGSPPENVYALMQAREDYGAGPH